MFKQLLNKNLCTLTNNVTVKIVCTSPLWSSVKTFSDTASSVDKNLSDDLNITLIANVIIVFNLELNVTPMFYLITNTV